MSKKLRVLALVLVAIFALSVFAGCGKNEEVKGSSAVQTNSEVADLGGESGIASENENGNNSDGNTDDNSSTTSNKAQKPGEKIDVNEKGWPIVNNKITVEIMAQALPSRGDPEKMSMFKYYEKMTNIKTKIIAVDETKMTERVTLALQSGDMPDMFTAHSWSDLALTKYTSGKKPALIDVSPYLDTYGPNMKKVLENDAVVRGLNTTAKGKIYTLPDARNKIDNYDHWLNINKKWLDDLGLKIPTTPDEFEKVLIAFRDQDPNGNGSYDEIPFAMWNWGANFIMSWWGVQTTSGSIGIDLDGKVYYPYATKNARAAATYWNKIRATAGIMDTSLPGKSAGYWAAMTEHIATGKVGSFVWSYLQGSRFPAELLKDYVAIPFPVANFSNPEINVSPVANPFNNTPSRGGEVITSSCKNIPAMVRYWDYFYTPDGIMLGNWGSPEDGTYKKNKDGTYTLADQFASSEGNYQQAMGWAMGLEETKKSIPHLIKKKVTNDPSYKNYVYDAYNEAAIKTYRAAHKKYPVYYMANYQKTAEEIAQLRKYENAGFTSNNGSMSSYVTGHWKIADFDTKVEGWNKKGLSGYLKIYQTIVDRNKENLINSATWSNEQ